MNSAKHRGYVCLTVLLMVWMLAFAGLTMSRADDEVKVSADAPRVAVIPFGNQDGTDGAREKCASALRIFIEKRGYRVVEGESVKKAYEDATGETPGSKDKMLTLRDKDLLKVGRTLKVDYVIGANLKWHTKSIYVFPTLRTKADCSVDALVVNVSKAEVVLDKHDVKKDSENKNAAAGVAAVLGGLGYGAISGGPKTPPQTKAGVTALYTALEEFVGTSSGPRKINDKDEGKGKK